MTGASAQRAAARGGDNQLVVEGVQTTASLHRRFFDNKEQASERTLCGHIEESKRGSQPWQPPYGTAGAVQAKVADSTLAASMALTARPGVRVRVRFSGREVGGYVVERRAEAEHPGRLMPIRRVVSDYPATPRPPGANRSSTRSVPARAGFLIKLFTSCPT